jgi:hypothetical protein
VDTERRLAGIGSADERHVDSGFHGPEQRLGARLAVDVLTEHRF